MRSLTQMERDILETVVMLEDNGSDSLSAIISHGGYNYSSTKDTIGRLRKLGCMYRRTIADHYLATEKGKIALAIIMGQEAKRRSKHVRIWSEMLGGARGGVAVDA